MPDLSVELHGIDFKNPVLVASGTFGYGVELVSEYPVSELGGICTKGLTLKPRVGNPPPRIKETPCGLLNSIGLENIGWERFVEEKLPKLKELGTRLIININGETEEEYLKLAELASETDGIDIIEVNASCPNVEKGGMEFGRNPHELEGLTRRIKSVSSKPIWIKLTPNFVDIVEEAQAAESGGADAVSLINTLLGTYLDIQKKRFIPAYGHGGLSGPAIFPFALYCVREVAKNVKIPVIGIGGIHSGDTALQFLMAGATLIQVGTSAMIDPRTPFRIINEIRDFLERNAFRSANEIIGIATH